MEIVTGDPIVQCRGTAATDSLRRCQVQAAAARARARLCPGHRIGVRDTAVTDNRSDPDEIGLR